LGRFLLGILIFFLTVFGLFFLFLSSPLPRVIAEKTIKQWLPETGYFKLGKLQLVPWQPFQINELEYQVTNQFDDGILKAKRIQLDNNFTAWWREKNKNT